MEVRYTASSLEFAGDRAIEHYTAVAKVTPKAGGAPMDERIKGIHIYQRQADGSWRITSDVWNSEAPPSPPPTPR
jgi:ketosteroid isomerase-like protein